MTRPLMVVAALLMVEAFAAALERPSDTLLVLKNGSEVRGALLEIRDGFYNIELKDGRSLRANMAETPYPPFN